MTILEVYQKYQIMPQLQEHQLRVAGVAKAILENLETDTDRENVIQACLFHDMGNIIKFDLSITDKLLPGKFTKLDLEYWQKVKDEYVVKYGKDEHHAALKIAREVGASERVVELIDCIGFQNGQKNAETEDFGKKICAYSDMRVGPSGIIGLDERFADLRVRYDYKHLLMGGNENLRLEFEAGLREIEKQIFLQSRIKPEDITEDMIEKTMRDLKNIEI